MLTKNDSYKIFNEKYIKFQEALTDYKNDIIIKEPQERFDAHGTIQSTILKNKFWVDRSGLITAKCECKKCKAIYKTVINVGYEKYAECPFCSGKVRPDYRPLTKKCLDSDKLRIYYKWKYSSNSERIMNECLAASGFDDNNILTQYKLQDCGLIADFYDINRGYAIECQGSEHFYAHRIEEPGDTNFIPMIDLVTNDFFPQIVRDVCKYYSLNGKVLYYIGSDVANSLRNDFIPNRINYILKTVYNFIFNYDNEYKISLQKITGYIPSDDKNVLYKWIEAGITNMYQHTFVNPDMLIEYLLKK